VLLDSESMRRCATRLLPRPLLVTPNIPEAARLWGRGPRRTHEELERQARDCWIWVRRGAPEGGHASGDTAADLASLSRRAHPRVLGAARAYGTARHGSRSRLRRAGTWRSGSRSAQACEQGKRYVTKLLRARE